MKITKIEKVEKDLMRIEHEDGSVTFLPKPFVSYPRERIGEFKRQMAKKKKKASQ